MEILIIGKPTLQKTVHFVPSFGRKKNVSKKVFTCGSVSASLSPSPKKLKSKTDRKMQIFLPQCST